MDFTMSEKQKVWRDRVRDFMTKHVFPNEATYDEQMIDVRRQPLAGRADPRRPEEKGT